MAPAADGNQEFFDQQVRYQVFLQRYTTGVVNRLDEFLLTLDLEAAKKLEAQLDRLSAKDRSAFLRGGNATTARLKRLRETLQEMRRGTQKEIADRVAEEVAPIGRLSANRTAKIARVTVGIAASVPQVGQLERLLRTEPFQGRILSEWAKDWSTNRIDRATTAIRIGMGLGESSAQIATRLTGTKANKYKDGVLAVSRRGAQTIARTAATHTRAQADKEFNKGNAAQIQEVVFSAVLDTRTSDPCRVLDNTIYAPDDETAPYPPIHPNCRSVMLTRWKGQGAIDNKPYFEWLQGQSKAVQVEALGNTKAKLFRDGGLTKPKELINAATGRAYTLDQLERREAKAFEKAGLND